MQCHMAPCLGDHLPEGLRKAKSRRGARGQEQLVPEYSEFPEDPRNARTERGCSGPRTVGPRVPRVLRGLEKSQVREGVLQLSIAGHYSMDILANYIFQ